MRDAEDNPEIERLFTSVETRRPRKLKPIRKNTHEGLESVFVGMAIIGFAVAGVAGASRVLPVNDTSSLFTVFCLGAVAIICASAGELVGKTLLEKDSTHPLLLLGKTTILDREETEMVNEWATAHPRLVQTLGEWGAKTPTAS